MRRLWPISLILFFSLMGCATATPYQAAVKGSKGYTEQQIESDRWQVSFSGNSLTERQTVETYLLYRAAELTNQQGYDYFRVVQRGTTEDRTLFASRPFDNPLIPGFYCDYRFFGRHGLISDLHRPARLSRSFRHHLAYDPFWPDYDLHEIISYEAQAEIILGRGTKPGEPDYFSADEIIISLAETIIRPES